MNDSDPHHQQQEEEKKAKGIVVILVGAQGSGKTTFCNDVMAAARRSWCRVCQDTIANGKAGTKSQCLNTAAEAQKEGKSIFIDRCNLERDQRAEFVKLGGEQVYVHAVVLDLPAKLCISRSVKRTGHEGNLQGGKAAAVVNRMLQKKELPKLSEGFSRITFCQNEADVRDAVKTYSSLGPFDCLPSGVFGQKNPDTKVQLGIMKFLKKAETPNNASDGRKIQCDGNGSQVKAAKKNIDHSRFFTFVGDITRLRTEGSIKCAVIANAANWRLKPGSGGVNAAIFKAAGEALESATKEKVDTLSPGSSVTVPLPSTSPLYRREGVTHVIHVLGPNMNPQRPNCLKNDYIKGCKVLRDAYASLFENFASIARGQRCNKERDDDSTHDSKDRIDIVTEGGNSFHSVSDQKNKQEGCHKSESNKKCTYLLLG